MLVIQMWTRVSSDPIVGQRRLLARERRDITDSFIRFSDVDSSCAGRLSGAAPLARSASMTAGVWSIHFCMNVDHSSRTSGLVYLAAAAAAQTTARWARNGSKKTSMPAAPELHGGPSADLVDQRLERGVGLGDDALEQRQQHRVLGREVEVEGRARDPGALGQVVDRDLGAAAALRAAARRWSRIASSRSSPDGRAARRPRPARGWLAVVTALTLQLSNFSTHC